MSKYNIKNKIIELGQVKPNPLCNEYNSKENVEDLFIKIETKYEAKLPDSYKELYRQYNAFAFNKKIVIQCDTIMPIGDENHKVNVDFFYSLEDENNRCSVYNLLSSNNMLKSKLLPICDGEPGDLICISLNKNDYGSVYYWYHEAEENKELFLIQDNFKDFLFKLEIKEEEEQTKKEEELVKNIKVDMSSDLLNMLRASGFGPK